MGAQQPKIQFTKETVEILRTAYNQAVEEGKESFIFTDNMGLPHEMHVGYTKYLLEHLDNEMERAGL